MTKLLWSVLAGITAAIIGVILSAGINPTNAPAVPVPTEIGCDCDQ